MLYAVQAVEILSPDVCGLDMSATNSMRWLPCHAVGVPIARNSYRELSEPIEVRSALHGHPKMPPLGCLDMVTDSF